MRISTFGIILLTAMVAAKYVISLNYLEATDGSFKNGIALDYSDIKDEVLYQNQLIKTEDLLAFNSSSHHNATKDQLAVSVTNSNFSDGESAETNVILRKTELVNEDEPLPMEHGNSLVVYDFSEPENNLISSNYEDVEDDIPLDNGNTIINGLMQIMPRR